MREARGRCGFSPADDADIRKIRRRQERRTRKRRTLGVSMQVMGLYSCNQLVLRPTVKRPSLSRPEPYSV